MAGPPKFEVLVVDGNNVMGAAAGGWWRDPPAAVRRLLGRLSCLAERGDGRILFVLDARQPDLPEGSHEGVEVRYATRSGPDAADERIVELLEEGLGGDVEVVTSDRALADEARRLGARVTGAGRFLSQLDEAGC